MTLYESILLEVRNGALSNPFEVQELTSERRQVMNKELVEKYRIGFEFFKKSAIGTTIANNASDEKTGADGHSVSNGTKAQYLRVKSGVYKVLEPAQ
ncbi:MULTISPECIES: hypothetical protein [unclassified Pseudomonas]|uniref:hypothetical protein n=1 Tax=unclassified Pseudomonas TaxID=196821 RepID=UPI00128C80B7|nr:MULTISPECIES: hypothetical protein [unclassified Pseudomonas]MPQ68520.1 hypothetical protein [Pseudomonas sp. MWU12-2323]